MPKTQDPHAVEAQEVAEQAKGGAATAGPSSADVAASEVFGEEVVQSPLAKMRGEKKRIEKSIEDAKIAQQEKEKLAEIWGKLSRNLADAGNLDVVVKIGECAGELGDLSTVDKILAILEPFEKASNKSAHPPDITAILLDLAANDKVGPIVAALRKKGVDLKPLVPNLESNVNGMEDRWRVLNQQPSYDDIRKEQGQIESKLPPLRKLLLALDPVKFQYRWG